jgi:hypothetical protein
VTSSTDVAETIQRRLAEIDAQLGGYDELANERERLQRALQVLRTDSDTGPGPRRARRSATERAGATRRRGARRARRGSNVEAIIGYVTANPGATAAEIAASTGIGRGVVYSATSRLASSGRLRRVAKGERQVGYALGGDDATRAGAPEPELPEAAVDSPAAVRSGATRGPGAGGENPRGPVDAASPAAKRARTGTRTVGRNARGAAKRVATAARAPAGGRPGAKRGGRASAGRRGAVARGRAPRGANRAAVLAVIGGRPGVSARELAAISGVGGGTLYALLRTLTQRGEITQQQLPSGHTGYTLEITATTAAPSPASHTAHDTPTVSAGPPAPTEHDSKATPTAGNESAATEIPPSEESAHDAGDSE